MDYTWISRCVQTHPVVELDGIIDIPFSGIYEWESICIWVQEWNCSFMMNIPESFQIHKFNMYMPWSWVFANDILLHQSAHTLDDHTALQHDWMAAWCSTKLLKFSTAKCKAMPLTEGQKGVFSSHYGLLIQPTLPKWNTYRSYWLYQVPWNTYMV